jgi:RNA polymerase sigma factor (sigma-70 family)
MATESAGVVAMTDDRERSVAIRSAVESEFERIARAVGTMVRAVERSQGHEWLRQRTEEVLSEALCRALERSGSYDSARPVVGWVVGIAKNVIRGEARLASGRPHRADLDEAAWESLLGIIDPECRRASDHLDLERMLARLSPGQREAIESRYLQGLTGAPLVEALGVVSPEAARTRVSRAIQALRDHFAQDGSEVAR